MALIEVIEPENAEGELKEVYDRILTSRGQLAEVHKIQSLNPKSIVNHMDLYITLMYGKSPVKRALREMIAVVVSKANKCEYCQIHHLEALKHYWKDDEKAELFRNDYKAVELSELQIKLCEFAKEHTLDPSSDKTIIINQLKELGLNDRAILDATLIIAYFNFVNRMVLGLKIELEADNGKGYKFD
jgi:uncharacterized peroxidase-related enzyme